MKNLFIFSLTLYCLIFSASAQRINGNDSTPPVTPSGLTASFDAASESVKLSWTANTEEDFLYYEISKSQNAKMLNADLYIAKNTQFADSNISANTTYYYSICAYDRNSNKSLNSPAVSCLTGNISPIPAQITGLSGSAAERTVTLHWNKSDDPLFKQYNIYFADNNFNDVSPLEGKQVISDIEKISTEFTMPLFNRDYYFAITQTNSQNKENKSVVSVKVTTSSEGYIAVENFYGISRESSVLLKWNTVTDLSFSEYIIFYDTNFFNNTDNAAFKLSISARETTEQLIDSLENGTEYYFIIVAVNGSGIYNKNVLPVLIVPGMIFTPRYSHSVISFNNKIWLVGGYNSGGKNDIWCSSDMNTWQLVKEHAEFSERYGHTCFVFDNKIWVTGGYNQGRLNDVWYSSDGVNWQLATDNAAFGKRCQHASAVYNNKMWVIGGTVDKSKDRAENTNDVWYSANGINWSLATEHAEFSARRDFTCSVFNGKMWIIAGHNGQPENDVWYSTNGINWFKVDPNPEFAPRYSHTSVVFDNKIWTLGGASPKLSNDIWNSDDGIVWKFIANADFSPRSALTGFIFDDKIWIIGGYDGISLNDIWFSGDGVSWTRQRGLYNIKKYLSAIENLDFNVSDVAKYLSDLDVQDALSESVMNNFDSETDQNNILDFVNSIDDILIKARFHTIIRHFSRNSAYIELQEEFKNIDIALSKALFGGEK